MVFLTKKISTKYLKCSINILNTVCPRSSDPFYIVTYYINWVIINEIWVLEIVKGKCQIQPVLKRGKDRREKRSLVVTLTMTLSGLVSQMLPL